MQDSLQEQARSRAAAQTKRRKRRIWVAGLCCAVAAATAYALTRPAQTMTQQTFCGQEAHTHDESCYETILICGQDEQLPALEPTPHVHTEDCYADRLVLVCGQEESEEHTHTADCCQTERELICPLEEGEAEDTPEIPAHVHTDACYETRLICEKPEHTHSLSCYADAQADLESASAWEQTIPRELSGQRRADVVAVAESQLGYAASTRNYIVDESGGMHGYTRYGAWYGSPYGEWCAMFASFCLHYAGVPEESIPAQAGCIRWVEQLRELGRYAAAGTAAPQPGDLVFFDTGSDGYADHVALVTVVSEDGTLTTIEGNVGGCVVRKQHALDEAGLLGFGILPEQEDGGETPEEPAEPETPARTPLCGHEEHTHTADCYDETGALICALEEHTHTDACYEPAAEKTPLCGMEEHTHTEDCYDADGALVCGLPEHTHTDACYAAASTQRFSYADAQLQLTLTVESAQPLPEGTELDVQAADAAVFAEFSDDEASDGAEQWIVRQLALVQDGEALDTAAYRMTAEIAVTDAVLQPLLSQLDALDEAAPEAETGVTLAVMQAGDEGLQELDSATISAAEAAPVFTVSVQSGTIAVLASSANPQFTVQYYAKIPRFDENGDSALTVFDTSGGVLPKNNTTNEKKSIYLTKTDEQTPDGVNAGDKSYYYTVATTDTLTQVYSDNTFAYISSPGLKYIDKLTDNEHYARKELWVLKENGDSSSTDQNDWTVYRNLDAVQFTNRAEVAAENPDTCIYIRPGGQTTLRLVYSAEEDSFTSSAAFYDYDITDGNRDGDYWLTGFAGINQSGNYTPNDHTSWGVARDTLAFGNADTGTGMANYKYCDTLYLNRHNKAVDSGCAFGLAQGLDANGHIIYNDWLIAPKLFNDGNASGKKTYSGSSLTFNRVGDTYTLSSASVAGGGSVSNLDKLFNPSPTAGTIYNGKVNGANTTGKAIYTNDFWPLDATYNKDPHIGAGTIKYKGYLNEDGLSFASKTENTGIFSTSDDGWSHNAYFGMQYAVEFTLTPDYVGPLEYTFFGDDDMWVFLDQQLVCDIGGVHSSVGEYVNLWDYINKIDGEERTETKTHTLTIFYTERGASGSTCYMNFTLPSVSGVTLKQTTGNLSVGKEVVGESDPTKDFTFRATFGLSDNFAYYRFDANGIRVGQEQLLASGQTFTLKAGEHIEFQNLPIGMQYSFEEIEHDGYSVTNTVNGVVSAGTNATGVLIKDMLNEVIFTNTRGTVPLTLQKLDQDGNPLAGAVFELKNAAGDPVYAMKDTDSASGQTLYTVPSSGANQIQSGALYYIALASDPSFVIGQDASAEKHNATLQQKADNGLQKFRVYRQTDGSYSFYCEESRLWLDLDNRGLENGTLVHFWSNADHPTTEDAQKWYLIANSDGTFKIKPRAAVLNQSTAVLGLNTGIASVGEKIQAWEDNGTAAQKWLLVPVEEEATPEVTKEMAVDEGGVLRLAGLLPGSYTLTETRAPAGYEKLSQSITFHVGADGTITLPDGTITDAVLVENILQVRNRHEDLTLTLKKELVNSQSTQKFHFTVTYETDGQTTTQELELAGGESGTLKIPYGAKVTITETEHDGFAVTFKNGETVLSQGDTCVIDRMTANAAITAVNAAGYALPGTGGSALWVQLAGAALVLLTLPAYNWIKTKKQKAKGRTRQ